MNRRRFLGLVGSGTAVVAGGCLESADAAGTASRTPQPTADEQPCPPYPTDRDRTVCSHTVTSDTASVYLTPDPRSSPLDDGTPVDEITLTLYNQSSTDLRFNPHSWRIWHLSDGDWSELDRQQSGDGVVTVAANGTDTWSFLETIETSQDDPELNPGRYAAEIGVPDPDTADGWVACIALIRFEPSE